MIDFHTHILPGMDDGSKDLTESLQMLRLEQQFGVDTVVLTPHFYSHQNSPEQFLRRRQKSWEILSPSLEAGMPQLLLGAEVQYFEGVANLEDVRQLCISGTGLLLLEMPFCSWDARMLQTVRSLNGTEGVQVVLAHIDRYLSFYGNARSLDFLQESGILMQMNADAFRGFFPRRKAASMVHKGKIQFLGSDCHDLAGRKPNWELVPDDVIPIVDASSKSLLRQHVSM